MRCVLSKTAKRQLAKHQRSNERAYKVFRRLLGQIEAAPSLPAGREIGLDIKKVHAGGFRIKQDGHRVLFDAPGSGEIEIRGLVLKSKGTYE